MIGCDAYGAIVWAPAAVRNPHHSLRDHRVKAAPNATQRQKQRDCASGAVAARIEAEENIGTLIGNPDILAQTRDVAIQIDDRPGQQRRRYGTTVMRSNPSI
jgi:hypothetical protein